MAEAMLDHKELKLLSLLQIYRSKCRMTNFSSGNRRVALTLCARFITQRVMNREQKVELAHVTQIRTRESTAEFGRQPR